jgi:hypothetical protein
MIEFNLRKTPIWIYRLGKFGRLERDERKYRLFKRFLRKFGLFFFSVSAFLFMLPQVWADSGQPAEEPVRPQKSYLVSLEYGWPAQFMAHQKYANFQQLTLILSREWEYGTLIIPKGHRFVESLLVELRLSRIWGKNIPMMPDQISPEDAAKTQQEGSSPTTDWDHYQIAVIPFYRVYYPIFSKARLFGEIGAGISWLNKPLVDNGTQWNFSLIAGLGIEREIYKIPMYIVLRAEHFSNGANLWGEFGFTKSNIGVESAVLGVGVRFH